MKKIPGKSLERPRSADFLDGTYGGAYQEKKIEEFKANLEKK